MGLSKRPGVNVTHNDLLGRGSLNSHPISAITGLADELLADETTILNHSNELGSHATELGSHATELGSHATELENHATELESHASQLADNVQQFITKGSQIKSSVLYQSALRDMDYINYNLHNVANAIKGGNLKIAFVGDSITEGAEGYYKDQYASLITKFLTEKLDVASLTIQNFALGGRYISLFNDDNYKATDVETNITTNFHRDWSVTGKSWKQHVLDFQPDLIILGFGMNEVQNTGFSGAQYAENLGIFKTWLNTSLSLCDLAIVSNSMPTENKTVYPQDTIGTIQVARVSREYAKNNNYPLIDANRLWRILLEGRDDESYQSKIINSVAELANISTEEFYNYKIEISISDFTIPTELITRHNRTQYISFLFFHDVGVNKMSVMINGNDAYTNTVTADNVIEVYGSKIIVNGVVVTDYNCLQDGLIYFNSSTANVSKFKLYEMQPMTEKSNYTETDLIGVLGDATTTSNGINHPTPLGHRLGFYNASKTFFNSMLQANKTAKLFPRKMKLAFSAKSASPDAGGFASHTTESNAIYYFSLGNVQVNKEITSMQDYVNSVLYTYRNLGGSTNSESMVNLKKGEYWVYSSDGVSSLLFFVPTDDAIQNNLILDY